MKKHILMACCCTLFGGIAALAQTPVKAGLRSAAPITSTPNSVVNPEAQVKTMTCNDTIRYPLTKEQVLGTGAFAVLDVWAGDNEAISQAFLLSGSSLAIHGAEFYGRNNPDDGVASVTVTASVYTVDANYVPVSLVGSGNITFSDTLYTFRTINFAAPINVSSNYAIVIQPTSADGVIDMYVNNPLPGQAYDETFAKYKSSWYTSSSGNWIGIPAFTEIGNTNFEALIAPIVSYSINTSFTVSDASSCLGESVAYTNTTTPTSILSNRMYNYQRFNLFFGEATADSTYAWVMDPVGAPTTAIWASSHNYTYPTAGAKTPTLVTNGGFWASCPDFDDMPVTVNALPVVDAGSGASICQGSSATLTATGADTYSWDNGLGAGATHSPSPAATTTYTVTGTATASGCQNTDQVTVTVTPLENAGFNYSSNTLCTGGGNETPTAVTSGGTFSSSPAGLVFVSTTTGEIDMTSSTDGTYSITYTTAGTCPGTSSQNVTITAAPDATFTYGQPTYCSADADPSPSFGAGGSAGTFSSTTGLTINSATGVIDLSTSTPGTYSVTNTIAASGVCPADNETVSVTINQTPSATVSGGGQVCGTGTVPVTVTLTGSGPWDFTYTDGTSNTNVTAQATSPFTINASASGTYTVTTVSGGGCSAAGTGSATVNIFSNPVVSFGPIDAVCEGASVVTLPAGSPAGGSYEGESTTGNTFDPSVGAGTYSITYTYVDGNGCEGEASSDITVNPAPALTFGPVDDLCIYDAAITLGATPAGGTYTGPGVTGTSFDPAVAGLGAHNVTYEFEDGNGCSAAATQSIVVGECLALDENELVNLVILPNPAHDVITVSYDGEEALTQLMLLSDDGKVVSTRALSGSDFNEQIEISALAKGIYFVRLTGENTLITKKVIVQ